MDEYEWRRMKPVAWVTFMHAALPIHGGNATKAALIADSALAEFAKRFSVGEREDER